MEWVLHHLCLSLFYHFYSFLEKIRVISKLAVILRGAFFCLGGIEGQDDFNSILLQVFAALPATNVSVSSAAIRAILMFLFQVQSPCCAVTSTLLLGLELIHAPILFHHGTL